MKLIHHWRRFHGYSRFGANTALTAVTNLTLALLGLTSGVLVARLLGPHGRGELAAIQTWPTLIGYFVMLGTDAAVVYFSAGQPECTGRYAGSAAMVGLVASLPLVMVAYLAMPFLLSSQAAAIVTEARFYLFVIPVVALHALCAYVLRARRDFTAWNALRLTPTLAWLMVVAFAWTQSWAGVRFLATAYCAALALLLAPVGLVVRRRVGGSFLPDRGLLKPMLMYGVPCLMTNIPMILNLRMDQMVMAGLLAPEKLGLYVAAVAWAGTINPLLNAVAYVAFPEVAAKNDGAERIIFFARSTRLAALIAGLSAIVLMLLTPLGIVTFFGMKFSSRLARSRA
jgi:O-antigen/teichoic acid export membrane protein